VVQLISTRLSWCDLDLQPGVQVKGGATRQQLPDWIMASWAPDLFCDLKGFRVSTGLGMGLLSVQPFLRVLEIGNGSSFH
jgi:hypothetical protein